MRRRFDVVVCEGAGSPAEINLLDHDVANLRIAAEWAVLEWTEVEAREVLAGLNEFFFAHSWFDGAETFERLVSVTGGPLMESPVTLAAVAYRLYVAPGAPVGDGMQSAPPPDVAWPLATSLAAPAPPLADPSTPSSAPIYLERHRRRRVALERA